MSKFNAKKAEAELKGMEKAILGTMETEKVIQGSLKEIETVSAGCMKFSSKAPEYHLMHSLFLTHRKKAESAKLAKTREVMHTFSEQLKVKPSNEEEYSSRLTHDLKSWAESELKSQIAILESAYETFQAIGGLSDTQMLVDLIETDGIPARVGDVVCERSLDQKLNFKPRSKSA